jgi:hypothetical protein
MKSSDKRNAMAKILRIDRKLESTGREIVTVERRATKTKLRITMTQEQAWKIFNSVATFHSPEETYENLILGLPTRRHLTYWLGQIGHKFDVKLGRGRGFEDFLREVASRLCERSQQSNSVTNDEQKGDDMKKIEVATNQTSEPFAENKVNEGPLTEDVSEEPAQCETSDLEVTEVPPSENQHPNPTPAIGRVQAYSIVTMKIFADCAVQTNAQGVFDVLGRNFETSGALSWWLWRIGHSDKCKYTKRKDIIDAIRKVSAELHKDLSRDVGRRVSRW